MIWRVHLDDMLRRGQMGYRMYVMRLNHDSTVDMVFNPQLRHLDQGMYAPEDEFFLSDEQPGIDTRAFLQAMSDAAWEIGIKPKQIEDNSNELKATKYHLEDMRQLAGVKK
jgi:hypothetical protein